MTVPQEAGRHGNHALSSPHDEVMYPVMCNIIQITMVSDSSAGLDTNSEPLAPGQ